MENEQSIHSLRDRLRSAYHEIESLRVQTDRLEYKCKDLMSILERGGYLHRRKKARTDSTGGDILRWMRSHRTGQLDRVCVALAVHYTKRLNVLRQ